MTLINREDAIDELRHLIPYKKYHKGEWVHLLDKREVFKALNALPSADAVSREECDECKTDKEGVLLQQLAELQGDYETMKNAYEDALAEAEWIPCSERLPKRDELVLVTYKTTDRIHLCRYLDDGSENPWWSYIDDCCAWNNVVLAWMPLPTPYKGGDIE